MKGTPEQPLLRLLRAHRRRRSRRSARPSRRSTSCPTRASARSCRRSRTGRRSRSCSSRASWSAAADIVAEMYESGELAEVLGVEAPSDAPAEAPVAAEPRRAAAADREPPELTPRTRQISGMPSP